MKCREFRSKHVAFVDDLLSSADMASMNGHLGHCPGCSRLNVRIRRSLLLVHNLPIIEPSPDFQKRLEQRLRETRLIDVSIDELPSPDSNLNRMMSIGAIAALAAGLAMTGYLAAERQVNAPAAIQSPTSPDIGNSNRPSRLRYFTRQTGSVSAEVDMTGD